MWKLDSFASPAVKSFAEVGQTADFDTETQGGNGIYDMFTMPAINKGVGRSRGSIFMDGMHPLVKGHFLRLIFFLSQSLSLPSLVLVVILCIVERRENYIYLFHHDQDVT